MAGSVWCSALGPKTGPLERHYLVLVRGLHKQREFKNEVKDEETGGASLCDSPEVT